MQELEDLLLAAHSIEQRNIIIEWVATDDDKLNAVIRIMLGQNKILAQRASWVVSSIGEQNAASISPFLPAFVEILGKPPIHNAVIRNTLRMLSFATIPDELQGKVMDACFNYIINPKEPIAVKAFSLGILQNLSMQYPEIIDEIKYVIADRFDHETPAFKSRAKAFLAQASKL